MQPQQILPMETNQKIILDACCGSRMFWFDKNNPNVLFTDIRTEAMKLCDGRMLEIKPDIEADFTNMPHADGSFKLAIFDPPHMDSLGENSWMAQKYGRLFPGWEAFQFSNEPTTIVYMNHSAQ